MPLLNQDVWMRRQYVCSPCSIREKMAPKDPLILVEFSKDPVWFHLCAPTYPKMAPTPAMTSIYSQKWMVPFVHMCKKPCSCVYIGEIPWTPPRLFPQTDMQVPCTPRYVGKIPCTPARTDSFVADNGKKRKASNGTLDDA